MEFLRQNGLVRMDRLQKQLVTMIGVGGIGSATLIQMAKMGLTHIQIWDDDKIEPHNLPNQFYPTSAIGKNKVDAAKAFVKYMVGADMKVDAFPQLYNGKSKAQIVISAVDSMASRKIIWDHFKASDHNEFFIDARMGGLHYEIYTVRHGNKEDYDLYEASLFSDEEATPIPCTERAIIFNTMAIGADICAIIRLYCNRQEKPRKMVRDMSNMTLESDLDIEFDTVDTIENV